MKRLLIFSLVLVSIVAHSSTTQAVNLHPPTGLWGFCSTSSQIGCIKQATITPPGGTAVVATSTAQVTATGVTLRVECGIPYQSGNGAAGDCSSDLPASVCRSFANSGGLHQLSIYMGAQTYPTKIQLEIATGDYKPRFGLGIGTQKVKLSSNSDGSYTYLLDSIIDIIPTAKNSPIPIIPGPDYLVKYSEWVATATADGFFIKAQVLASPTIYGSCDLNYDGVWIDFNSQGFALGGLTGGPAGCGVNQSSSTCTSSTELTLNLKALSPHYKQQEPGKDLELNPARIVVYLPNKLLVAMGFSDPAMFDAKSLSVATKDGQTTTPTFERDADGILVNLGIKHYSEPDPVVTIASRVSAGNVNVSSPLGSDSKTSSTTKLNLVRKGTQTSRNTLLKIGELKYSSTSKWSIRVSTPKVCKVSGTGIKNLAKGTCKMVVYITPKASKTVPKPKTTSKKVSLIVS